MPSSNEWKDAMFKHFLFVVLLFFLAAVCAYRAHAGFSEAKAAYDKGDYITAYGEFKALAEQGNPDAEWDLGVMYYNGQGVPQDYDQAMKWSTKAAEQGLSGAQYNLGLLYAEGQAVPIDYVEAVRWFRRAANQGVAEAQYNLGVMYYKGTGIPQDFVQAHMWFNLAASQGSSEAMDARDKVAEKMTQTEIAQAQQLAADWKPKPETKGAERH